MSQSEVPESKIQLFQKLRSWHFQTHKQQLVEATAEGVAMRVTGREEVVVQIRRGKPI